MVLGFLTPSLHLRLSSDVLSPEKLSPVPPTQIALPASSLSLLVLGVFSFVANETSSPHSFIHLLVGLQSAPPYVWFLEGETWSCSSLNPQSLVHSKDAIDVVQCCWGIASTCAHLHMPLTAPQSLGRVCVGL